MQMLHGLIQAMTLTGQQVDLCFEKFHSNSNERLDGKPVRQYPVQLQTGPFCLLTK